MEEPPRTGSNFGFIIEPKFHAFPEQPLPLQDGDCHPVYHADFKSLKEIFKSTPPPFIVYERIYPNCKSIREKKGYYLTTLFNMKKYVYMQKMSPTFIDKLDIKNDNSYCYQRKDKDDKTLLFDSRFESGNLAVAI